MFNRKQYYGDYFKYSKHSDFVTDKEYYSWDYKRNYDEEDRFSVQCNLITGGNGLIEIDPKTLSYPNRLKWRFKKFCNDTTAHGIYMISDSSNIFSRFIWLILFLACMLVLYQNARSVVAKYNRSEKIVNIQLKFDNAPFPSVTVCNLNPYKASVATNVESIRRTLSAFDGAMNRAGIKVEEKNRQVHNIMRRATDNKLHFFEPGLTKCVCSTPPTKLSGVTDKLQEAAECDGDSYKTEQLLANTSKCICAFDRNTKDAWPCYPENTWEKTFCGSCDENSFCKKTEDAIEGNVCLCAPTGEVCMTYNDSLAIVEIWKHMAGIDEAVFLKAMGFEVLN